MNYTWEQEFNEITVIISLPSKPLKSDLNIELDHKILTVLYKNEIILEKEFINDVSDELIWYFEENKLYITVTKIKNEWWDSCFIGDEKIDVVKLAQDVPVGLDKMDDEARQCVEKMIFEQKNNQNGFNK